MSKTVQIASKQAGITVRSSNPRFEYSFKEADEPIEVPKEHADKILINKNLYEVGKKEKVSK